MPDKETVKKKLFEMLDNCNEILSNYKDLRSKGMSNDEVFEAIWNTRKQVVAEILEIIAAK